MSAAPPLSERSRRVEVPIGGIRARAYTIPTDAPESDGTLRWSSTTLVTAWVQAGGQRGFGYTYADAAAAAVIGGVLAEAIDGLDALDIERAWEAMHVRVRNIGRDGIAACAISAVDVALWDLKAKLLDLPAARLIGRARDAVMAYGSGGFTSYDDARLASQLSGWATDGLRAVKMKVGRDTHADPRRVRVGRDAIGPDVELMVDANGAWSHADALAMAERFAPDRVIWLEEPVSSDDLSGLRLLRDRAPAGMAIAAGEYGYSSFGFRRLLDAGAVDVLQVDATRCGGYTGFLRAAVLADAAPVPISSHCAPALHLPVCLAAPRVRHMEYFHDHVRIEQLLLDGVSTPERGDLTCDLTRPGIGLELKETDAARFAI